MQEQIDQLHDVLKELDRERAYARYDGDDHRHTAMSSLYLKVHRVREGLIAKNKLGNSSK